MQPLLALSREQARERESEEDREKSAAFLALNSPPLLRALPLSLACSLAHAREEVPRPRCPGHCRPLRFTSPFESCVACECRYNRTERIRESSKRQGKNRSAKGEGEGGGGGGGTQHERKGVSRSSVYKACYEGDEETQTDKARRAKGKSKRKKR